MCKYLCECCGYIFNEEKEGKEFDKLDDDWKCPCCGVSKKEFRKIC
jgi:methylamine---glutamate N-methyltransferase subunit C